LLRLQLGYKSLAIRVLVLDLSVVQSSVVASLLTAEGKPLATEESTADQLAALRRASHSLLEGSAQTASIETYGRMLGEVACDGSIREILVDAIQDSPVRLLFKVSPALCDIAWEFLWLQDEEIGFVAQHPTVRVSRLEGSPREVVPSDQPLKVLVVAADPQSSRYPQLASLERELKAVREALRSPECRRVHLDVLENATPNALGRRLKTGGCDVFHFLGHGDHRPSGGVIALEGHLPNEASEIYGDELATMLVAAGSKLVVLSGCMTAGKSASIGSQLIIAGVPAVVGMQLPINDVNAQQFARAFYASLALGASVEEAVFDGRMAIRGSGLDWGAPVLTTCCPAMTLASLGLHQEEAKPARGNLPKPITSFIGRSKEIAEVCDALRRERLIVLLGSGGIGKTRLSIEIGRASSPLFAHGVWQVLLDSLSDSAQVIEAIARVFGISDASETPVEERLFEFLKDQELLIILDNCEHLVEACRHAAKRILTECPKVKILATSRIVLGTGADHIIQVPPLSYPEVSDVEPNAFPVAETIRDHEALQLLVERGRSANSRFEPKDSNIEALCRIAKRVDGIPLAIEIAASRFRSFTPHQVQEQLQTGLAWLEMEAAGAVDRHKTLRAALDWSYRMLSHEEQRLFNRLAVFAGTFSLAGAESVGADALLSKEEIPDLLADLVDQSLVIAEEGEREMRYHLLDTCKAYAKEALDNTGETEAALNRYLDYCVDLSQSLYALEVSLDLVLWQSSIKLEHENLVSACDWALGGGHAAAKAGEILIRSVDYWLMIGFVNQTAHLIDRILPELSPDEEVMQIRLNVLGGTIAIYGKNKSGLDRIRMAHARAKARGETNLIRYAASKLGECAYELLEEETAIETFNWVIDHCKEIGEPKMEGYARLWLSNIEINRANYDEAARHLEQMMAAKGKLGDIRGLGVAHCTLAFLEQLRGRSSSIELYNKGMAYLAQIHDIFWLACFLILASDSLLQEAPNHAASIQGLAERLREDSETAFEPYMKIWVADVICRTKSLLGSGYDKWFGEGRTMTLDEAFERLFATPALSANP
jgi:predicted ATPase